MRTSLDPISQIARDIPTDFETDREAKLTLLKSGMHEILSGQGCKCVGERGATQSIDDKLTQTFRALAVARALDASIREIAIERGIDPASSPSLFAASVTPDEMTSLQSYTAATMTIDKIEALVPNEEMATISAEQTAQAPGIRDRAWTRDIDNIVARTPGHPVTYLDDDTGLYVVVTLQVRLETLVPEVDDNGEICCWTYEEPVI